jgi:arylsulfatase A-like enzyme
LCGACGLRAPDDLDGSDLWPRLTRGESIAPRSLFWHFPAYLEAYREGASPWRTTPAGAIVKDGFKLIQFFETDRYELYDLVADPSESRPVEDPALRAELAAELDAWQRRVSAPIPTEREPRFVEVPGANDD